MDVASSDWYILTNISQEGAYDEAVKAVDGIVHVASPVIFIQGDPERTLYPPCIPLYLRSTLKLFSAHSSGCQRYRWNIAKF